MPSQPPLLTGLVASRVRIVIATLASGVIAGALEYIIHTAVTGARVALDLPTIIDSAMMAGITAGLVYILLTEWRARRRLVVQRLRIIAELNHNVRNALQMILYSRFLPPTEQTQALLDSVDRIESTLEELFPAIGQHANEGKEFQDKLRFKLRRGRTRP